jgi:hypothetical protein
MAGIDWNRDGKIDFDISLPQVITVLTLFASFVGSYYSLQNKISELDSRIKRAEELPAQEVSVKDIDALKVEYDLKIEKVAIQAKENMDEIKAFEKEVRNHYKRNR